MKTGTTSRRWARRPEGSTWGDFGENDTLGRLNLLTSEKVRQGLNEVLEARTFALGLPLTLPGGNVLNANRLPPVHRPNLRGEFANASSELRRITPGATDVLSDDLWIMHTQYSTQWDALAHAGSLFDANDDGTPEPVYYNGFRPEDGSLQTSDPADCTMYAGDGEELNTTVDFGPLGAQNLATKPIQGRAVLIDLAHHFGTEPRLVGFGDLQHVLEEDAIDVHCGDIVLFHTGFAAKLIDMGGSPEPEVAHNYGAVLDGRDTDLLHWITESQIAAIAADNNAVESYPATPAPAPFSVLPLHEHCLFRLGLPLGELWHLSELASHLRSVGRSACLLTAPGLNLPGSSGSPLNPIATV